jgi:hypothetical protein
MYARSADPVGFQTTSTSRWKRAFAVGALVAAVCTVFGLVDPADTGSRLTCPFHTLTGLDCPGCGSVRAVHALLHGHPTDALGYNGLLLVVLPIALGAGARWIAGLPPTQVGRAPKVVPAMAIALVTWMVLRNLPIAPLSALAA